MGRRGPWGLAGLAGPGDLADPGGPGCLAGPRHPGGRADRADRVDPRGRRRRGRRDRRRPWGRAARRDPADRRAPEMPASAPIAASSRATRFTSTSASCSIASMRPCAAATSLRSSSTRGSGVVPLQAVVITASAAIDRGLSPMRPSYSDRAGHAAAGEARPRSGGERPSGRDPSTAGRNEAPGRRTKRSIRNLAPRPRRRTNGG